MKETKLHLAVFIAVFLAASLLAGEGPFTADDLLGSWKRTGIKTPIHTGTDQAIRVAKSDARGLEIWLSRISTQQVSNKRGIRKVTSVTIGPFELHVTKSSIWFEDENGEKQEVRLKRIEDRIILELSGLAFDRQKE